MTVEHLSAAPAPEPTGREYYELRSFKPKPGKQALLDNYFSKAFLPAVHRMGAGPVGVFSEKSDAEPSQAYVLIVFRTPEQAATLDARLTTDTAYQQDAAEYLAATPTDAVYDRIESSLLGAIAGMPKLEKPDPAKPRIFNLRIYESHNERAALKKIELFNTRELAIFRKVGLTPVFFGQTLIGSRMPNLTYMLVFPDDAARGAAWGRFGGDEDWKKVRGIPEYADKEIVSKITNKILLPSPYSEI